MNPKILVINVLVVDDYAPLREATVEVLKSKGFRNVLEAGSPEEGMKMFKDNKPDLVLMDIIMPTTRGIDLTREIKEINPNTKIVMLSVLSGEAPRKESFKAGADMYLVKPLTPEKVDEIKEILKL